MQENSPHSKVTIKDVAEKAGVSAMTVSRVMRNQGKIAPETRALVLKVISELSYEPLSSARNLSGAYSRTIGIVIPDANAFREFRHGYEYEYALLIGALNVCKSHDFAVNIIETRNAQDIHSLVRKVLARQVGGYIVPAPASEYVDLLKTLRQHDLAFSAISAFDATHADLAVVADERSATRALAERMLELGHRRIAFIGGAARHRATVERQAGFLEAIAAHPDRARITHAMHHCNAFFDDGFEMGMQVLSRPDRPTAVQCLTDDIAAGVIAAATRLHISLPDGLSIAGFDNFGLARKITPALTTAGLPAEDMGEAAALQVIEALEGRSRQGVRTLPCNIVMRDSITRPAGA
ncbi:LacI family DNA-binding transcriptional regulator [Sphaerotilus mobilis]|uniref:LacI family transcriptional regulator n=1 Tax=Sphaerotilus mobilis TaxID=47994 RepID=A0A4Q7L8F4_9BURK|nr:LacI family DNA-binding transcriptional regulator [Sphaerotilus mobilis]RZS46698.1 LacI family transcriptional regulator [Sphaerotilus mobilis]